MALKDRIPSLKNPKEKDEIEIPADELMTPDIYWNSRPAEVRELRSMSGATNRYNRAVELTAQGFLVDRAIDVDQAMDPYTCQLVRSNNGYTWVPSFGQPPLPTAPGADLPGLPPYDPDNPPEGSLIVSILAKDYPPQPDIPPAPIPVSPVGDPFILPDGTVAYYPGPGLNQANAYNGMQVQWEGVNYLVTNDSRNKPPVPMIYLTVVVY